jgi:hypothetical protein
VRTDRTLPFDVLRPTEVLTGLARARGGKASRCDRIGADGLSPGRLPPRAAVAAPSGKVCRRAANPPGDAALCFARRHQTGLCPYASCGSLASGIPEPVARAVPDKRPSSVGGGLHVHPHRARLWVSRRPARSVLATRHRLGDRQTHRCRTRALGAPHTSVKSRTRPRAIRITMRSSKA